MEFILPPVIIKKLSSKKRRKINENFSSLFALGRTGKARVYAVFKGNKRGKM